MPTNTPISDDAIDTARTIVEWFRGQRHRLHEEQANWPLYCQLQAKIQGALQAREDARQEAYRERNEVVAWLSRLYPGHLAKHPDEDQEWALDWRTIVCLHIPMPGFDDRRSGTWTTATAPMDPFWTATWHIHDSDVSLFSHLEMRENDSDGSSTEQTYERLRRLT